MFFLPFLWLLIGILWGCRRTLLWTKGSDEIKLICGVFPIYKTSLLRKNEISAKLEWLDQSKTLVAVYLYNHNYLESRVNIIGSIRRLWVIPVFDQLIKILGNSCIDETC
jgi:hypothetical protein